MDVRHTPVRGIEPRPRRWERRILATRPHGIESCNNMLWVYKGRFSNLENRHFRRRWSEIRIIPMYTMFESTIKNMLPSSINCDLLIALCVPEKHGTPLRGIEPRPRRWKRRILATRPQGIGKRDDLLKPDDEEESFVFSTLQWLRLFVFLNFLHLSGHILAGLSGVKRTAIFFPQIEVTWVYDL